jgi:AcrR family transcriptional regulator
VPRKRTVSDATVLDGVLAVMQRLGPDGVTFQAVAQETGLAAPTLVQRFRPKPAMIRAALLRAWDALDAATEKADEAAPLTPAGAVSFLVALTGDGRQAFEEGLPILREDYRDPVLRRRGARWGRRLAEALDRRLATRGAQRRGLGGLMAAQWQGAVIWWGFSRNGPLKSAVAKSLHNWCAAIFRPSTGRRGP